MMNLIFCLLSIAILLTPWPAQVAAETVQTVKSKNMDVIVDVAEPQAPEKITYEWRHDPFLKTPGYGKRRDTGKALELSAILISEDGQPVALINGKTVFENSLIDGHAVREIGPNYVVLETGKSLMELQLAPVKGQVSTEINLWDRLPAVEQGYEPRKSGK